MPTPAESRVARDRRALPVAAVALLLAALHFHWRAGMVPIRRYDPDELAHVQRGWLVSQGLVPYRDYFDHHTPLFHHALALWLPHAGVEEDPRAATRFLTSARWVMTGLAAGAVGLTLALGASAFGPATGAAAAAILSGTLVFVEKSAEIRADVPSLVLWLGALLLGWRFLAEPGRSRMPAAASGALVGLGVLANLKLVCALPPLALAVVALRDARGARGRLGDLAAFAAGLAVPLAGFLVHLVATGSLAPFLEHVVHRSASWLRIETAWPLVDRVWRQNAAALLLGVSALFAAGRSAASCGREAAAERFLAWTAVALLACLFLIPEPRRQFVMLLVPPLAILAARQIERLVAGLAGAAGRVASGIAAGAWATIAVAAVATAASPPAAAHAAAWALALAGAAALARRGRDSAAVALMLAVVSLGPTSAMDRRGTGAATNRVQQAEIRWVIRHTAAADTALGGWRSQALFRRPAFFEPFFPRGWALAMPPERIAGLVRALRTCAVAPRVVLLDRWLELLSPEIAPWVAANYERTRVGNVFVRRPDANCEPERPPEPPA